MEWFFASVFAATSASVLSFILKYADDIDKASPWIGEAIKAHVNSVNPQKWDEVSKLLRQLGASVFDRAYGANPLSLKFFVRSVVFSAAAWLAITSFCLATGRYISSTELTPQIIIAIFSITGLLFLSSNVFGDYVSLIVTRFFIKKVSRASGVIESMAYVALDFMCTVICFSVGFHYLFPLAARLLGFDLRFPLNIIGDALWFASFGHSTILIYKDDFMSPILLPFFANILTSMWIWLTVAASSSATILASYGNILRFLNGTFDSTGRTRFDFATRPTHSVMILAIFALVSLTLFLAIIEHL